MVNKRLSPQQHWYFKIYNVLPGMVKETNIIFAHLSSWRGSIELIQVQCILYCICRGLYRSCPLPIRRNARAGRLLR